MSEIAACTLIQEEPDRKTERYMMMFKDYPDVVSVDILQEMLGICRKNAYLLVKQNKIHSARVGRSYKIPKLCVVEYLIDQNRELGGMRLSNSLAPSLQNTPESSKLTRIIFASSIRSSMYWEYTQNTSSSESK